MFTRLLLLLSLFFGSNLASAQSFAPVSGALLQQEVNFEQANECYMIFDNPSGDSLTLRWRQLEVSMPSGWDADLCDYGLCYSGIPGNGIMNPVFGSTQPYLKLIVQPGSTAGAAWLWFRVWEDGNEDNFVDVYFSLHTPGTLGTTSLEASTWRFYPNPAGEFIVVDNPAPEPLELKLTDQIGRIVKRQTMPPLSVETLPLNDLSPGVYFLQSGRQTEKLIIRR